MNSAESSMVTTTSQSKDTASVASNASSTDTVNASTPAASSSAASVKTEVNDYPSRINSGVQSSVMPPSQPTKVSTKVYYLITLFHLPIALHFK
jgi:hypothetical protein